MMCQWKARDVAPFGRRVIRASSARVLATLLLTLTACTRSATDVATAPSTPPASASASASGTLQTACAKIPDIQPSQFPAVPSVTNPYLPYVPGTQSTLSGTVASGGHPHPHLIVTTVTDLTKMIDGVPTVVVYEQDLQLGVVQESELLFVAQDVTGSVWHIGEYPEVYEHGHPGAPEAWLSGVAGAEAGIDMPPTPYVGEVLMQGYSPKIFWDCTRVESLHRHRCVPTGCYSNVVLTNEWSPVAPNGGHQLKFSAAGFGTIAALPLHEPHPEIVHLVKVTCLSSSALAAIDTAALAEDQRAYHVIKPIYSGSPPAARTPGIQTC